jgi:hypothetical protein
MPQIRTKTPGDSEWLCESCRKPRAAHKTRNRRAELPSRRNTTERCHKMRLHGVRENQDSITRHAEARTGADIRVWSLSSVGNGVCFSSLHSGCPKLQMALRGPHRARLRIIEQNASNIVFQSRRLRCKRRKSRDNLLNLVVRVRRTCDAVNAQRGG